MQLDGKKRYRRVISKKPQPENGRKPALANTGQCGVIEPMPVTRLRPYSGEEAVAQFYATIAHAFTQGPDYPETPTNERERYAAALIAVARFCDLKDQRLGQRFFELASAIADLNSGTVSPLLRPIEPNNRHADPSRLWRARVRVALALEALICSGLSARAAATQLAHKFPKIARLAGAAAKNSTLQTTIGGWRKALSADKVKNFEARELFLAGLEHIRKLPKTELSEFSRRQLADVMQLSWGLSPGG